MNGFGGLGLLNGASRVFSIHSLCSVHLISGYQSSLSDFKGLLSYRAALEKVQFREALSRMSFLFLKRFSIC